VKQIKNSYFGKMLAYFLIFSLVPVLTLGVLSYGLSKTSLEDTLVSQAQSGAERISDGIDRLIQQHGKWLDLLSEDVDVISLLTDRRQENYYRCNYKLMLTTGGNSELFAVHVVGASDQVSATTKTVPRSYLYPYNQNWGIFRKAADTDQIVVYAGNSDLNSPYDTIMSLGKAVRGEDGQCVGYVVIDLMRENFTPLLTEQFQAEIFMADSNNCVAFSSLGRDSEGVGGLPESLRAQIADTRDRQIYHGEDGFRYALIVSHTQSGDFTVVSNVPLEQVSQGVGGIRNVVAIISLISFLVCCVAAYFVARNVSAPIQDMTGMMQKVEAGDFSVHTRFARKDEIGIMGRAFNHMTDQLQDLIRKVEEKQRGLRIAETQALQAQISPHFLYNTLDLIKWNARMGDTERVSQVTIQLGKLLRYLANNQEDEVSVAFELEFIGRYMDIQRLRFGERLTLCQDVDDELLPYFIPKLILQPAVENAVVHGLDNVLKDGRLTVRGRKQGEYLVFTVSDNGCGIPEEQRRALLDHSQGKAGGLGLRNMDMRARLYGDEHCGIRLDSAPGKGTTVTVTLLAKRGGAWT